MCRLCRVNHRFLWGKILEPVQPRRRISTSRAINATQTNIIPLLFYSCLGNTFCKKNSFGHIAQITSLPIRQCPKENILFYRRCSLRTTYSTDDSTDVLHLLILVLLIVMLSDKASWYQMHRIKCIVWCVGRGRFEDGCITEKKTLSENQVFKLMFNQWALFI